MEAPATRKVTAKMGYDRAAVKVYARPPSPTKSTVTQSPSSLSSAVRPKAKVNASAQLGSNRSNIIKSPPTKAVSSLGRASPAPRPASPIRRPASPLRPSPTQNGRLSPGPRRPPSAAGVRSESPAPSTVRRPKAQSIFVPNAAAKQADIARIRNGSISSSSQIASTPSSGDPSKPPSRSESASVPGSPTFQPVRVKSKVTKLAKAKPSSSSPPSPLVSNFPSPSLSTLSPPTHSSNRLHRSSSISSMSTSPPIFYPITTASPAANVHRFASPRSSFDIGHGSHTSPQPDTRPLTRTAKVYITDIDPALVPLPPQSPPSSTVSYSSRSSTSHSSASAISRSTAPTVHSQVTEHADSLNGGHLFIRPSPDDNKPRRASIVIHGVDSEEVPLDSPITPVETMDEDRKLRDEAKSNRKIADLEITNRSLLAINSSLEAVKHKQAKEIRELRRKLRESRLILPPIAYRAVEAEDTLDEADDEDDDTDGSEIGQSGQEDAAFLRVKGMLDMLLQTGRKALETKVEDHIPGKGGTRVLHEEEARTWRLGHDASESMSLEASYPGTDGRDSSRSRTPSIFGVAVDAVQDLRSEDEVEDLIDSVS